jgi:hypothetical protein
MKKNHRLHRWDQPQITQISQILVWILNDAVAIKTPGR